MWNKCDPEFTKNLPIFLRRNKISPNFKGAEILPRRLPNFCKSSNHAVLSIQLSNFREHIGKLSVKSGSYPQKSPLIVHPRYWERCCFLRPRNYNLKATEVIFHNSRKRHKYDSFLPNFYLEKCFSSSKAFTLRLTYLPIPTNFG